MSENNNPFAPEWVVLGMDAGKEGAPRYKIRALDGLQQQDILKEMVVTAEGEVTIGGAGVRAALKYGLLDWENQTDEQDAPLEFSRDNIRLLPGMRLFSIAEKIIYGSKLADAARKNS
jgi:hypothetical protein